MMRKLINKSCLSLRPPLPYATQFCFVAEKLSALYLICPRPAAGSPGPSARCTGPYGATVERRAAVAGQGRGVAVQPCQSRVAWATCSRSSILPSLQGNGQECGHEFQLSCLPPCDLGLCRFTLPSLSFLICKVGIITAPVLESLGELNK